MYDSEGYKKAGVKIIDNTSQEIFDVVKEMYHRQNGLWSSSEEDEILQKKFKSLFTKKNRAYGSPARLGTDFLKNNKFLLK